jgi:hypothetical protein
MRLTYRARIQSDGPASQEFSAEELQVLEGERQRRDKRAAGPVATIEQAVRVAARLGGHLGRKGDGPPA